ncbi:MAG: family 1 encapsulin nanocompartment shell protein [Desulfurococcaceae archaeon]
MSKNPLDLVPGKKLSREEVVEALRLSIIAELDAINLYLQLSRAVDDERFRKVFEDIAREEKTHVGEFLALLKHLDPEQVEELRKGEEEVKELAGVKAPGPGNGSTANSPSRNGGFEETVVREVKKLTGSARVLTKKLPTTLIGRGADSVSVERAGEKLERAIIPLCEISHRFIISQRAVDYSAKTGQHIEMPGAIGAALSLATEEDRAVTETLLREGKIRLPLGTWDDPGASVVDIAKAVSELVVRGFRRPYMLIINQARYVKLLAVSEKTGVTDLERIKMLVDEVVVFGGVPEDKALVISATPDVLDVVYGGDAEVDYLGPEDGYHAFRLWSTMAVRVRNPDGIVVMEVVRSGH